MDNKSIDDLLTTKIKSISNIIATVNNALGNDKGNIVVTGTTFTEYEWFHLGKQETYEGRLEALREFQEELRKGE